MTQTVGWSESEQVGPIDIPTPIRARVHRLHARRDPIDGGASELEIRMERRGGGRHMIATFVGVMLAGFVMDLI